MYRLFEFHHYFEEGKLLIELISRADKSDETGKVEAFIALPLSELRDELNKQN